ncbi:uncharacterized protein PHACADRAFT_207802 [Phanerochaete carnosa HHB-10118-sp]|uniref:Fungal-type protein kinase domain-containing protein n=1 Tax=Phanerochaete carnosa (strain HHB-10118-sp) TaxID=650164 RepID=K5X1E9_PHACS|nr:uncharacterized protein PHACADRAFT_207802 [Phanerochaete carnosa HHB-10118-sp]EKM56597.1 hypothetical protein PHACADRAFT_207802 [Phanerochaete carnosa HHB-10118-sp]
MSRDSRPPRRPSHQRQARPLSGPGNPSFDTVDDFPATHPESRAGALPPHISREDIEGDSARSILFTHKRIIDPEDTSDPGAPPRVKFVRHYTFPSTPEPSESPKFKRGAPGSPAVSSMAVDAKTQKDGDSPLKSLSWSETTVAQVDDRCIQVPLPELKNGIPGTDLTTEQKQTLSTFRGIDTKNLPDNSESRKYGPLCDIFNEVEELAGSRYRWKVVANHGESAEIGHKPDLARYPIDIPAAALAYNRDVAKDDPNIARCAWAWMNSYVEVKNAERKSPFFFARNIGKDGRQKFLRHGDVGKKARGQFIKYVTEAMLRQHRTHYYSFYLSKMSACVFRWDRVGCIASEPIDLKKNPKAFLNILYRLATSEDGGGVDDTVQLASEEDISLVNDYDPKGNQSLQEYRDLLLDDRPSYPIYKASILQHPLATLGLTEADRSSASLCLLMAPRRKVY